MNAHKHLMVIALAAAGAIFSFQSPAQDAKSSVSAENLLSFERMGCGVPAGWRIDGKGYAWSAENALGPLGVGAAQIKFQGSGKFELCSPARAMRSQIPHVVAFWLRSQPPGAAVKIEVIDSDNEDKVEWRESFTAGADWQLVRTRRALPNAVKGRYFLQFSAAGTDCTIGLDGLWMGECEKEIGDDWRPAVLPAGVALEPQAGWGVVAGDSPMTVNARVVGATQKGCTLSLRAVDTLGATVELPAVKLDESGVWKGLFSVSDKSLNRFGMVRVEAKVNDSQGRAISKTSETLLARVLEPVPGPLPESYFGTHVSLRETDVAAVAKLGYKWCRIHDASTITKWGCIETEPGKWTWHDDEVAMVRRHGLNIVGLLDSAPTWHTGAEGNDYFNIFHAPKDVALWRNYVRQVVAHYAGSIDEWEVWNEPWNRPFFQGGSPQLYAELLKAAYEEAKATNPASTIIGIDTYPPIWEKVVLGLGSYPYYDLLSWHRYDPTLQGRPHDTLARISDRLAKAQQPYGQPKPTLCTEGGPDMTIFHGSFFSFADPLISGDWSEGADRYARMFLSMIAAGHRRFISYSVHGAPRYGVANQMMVEPGFLLRPMHVAVAALAYFVDAAKYDRRLAPAPDISAHVFRQTHDRPYAKAPGAVVVLIADGPDPEALPNPVPPGVRCFDRWGNPIDAPKQATRSPVYLVAAGDAQESLIRSLQPVSSTPPSASDVKTLIDAALKILTTRESKLSELFSAQGSLLILADESGRLTAIRAELRNNPALAAKFHLPPGVKIVSDNILPAEFFTVGSFALADDAKKWTAAFTAVPDGPGGSWRFLSLTILPDAPQTDSTRADQATGVLKLWENALREANISKLYDTLYAGPCCLTTATKNGDYYVFANPAYLMAIMNVAVFWGPAPTSKMEFTNVTISGNTAAVVGRWDVASPAYGLMPYRFTATLFEENGRWKIAAFSSDAN